MSTFLRSFHLYALISILLWATSYVLTKFVVDSYSPGCLSLLRCAVASCVLFAAFTSEKLPVPSWLGLLRLLPAGFVGLALYFILFNEGTYLANPSTVSIIIATAPVITPVLARIVYRESLPTLGWIAILLAFGGISLMTLWNGTVDVNMGVVWTALAALAFSIYMILQRWLAQYFLPLQISTFSFIVGTACLLYFLPQLVDEMRAAPAWKTALAVYLGVFPTAFSYLSWVKALALAPKTGYCTNYLFVTPFLSLILEFILMAQFPDTPTILGGGIILASLALFTLAGKREEKLKV